MALRYIFVGFPWRFCILEALRVGLGFTAFSTIGYGDVTPKSGAGRAVFVFWAIGSVAAMTVFISVIAEAYQSRYSTIMQHDLFNKQIRDLKETKSLSRRNTEAEDQRRPTRDLDDLTIDERIEALESVRQELAGLPELITQDARDFQVHIRYVGNPNPGRGDKLPPGLERVLQETMDQENMNEAMQKKALNDEATKKALMMLRLETTVQQLVDKAERLTVLLAERDALEREARTPVAGEFDDELAGPDGTPVEVEVGVEEEGERRTRDEEMGEGGHWVMDDRRLHTQPQGSPSRSVSRSSRTSRRLDEAR